MKAVILTFDRLPISFLGCYGHALVRTPHFDRLASGSIVYDQHYAENIDPAAPAHAWTTGCFHFPRTVEQQQALPAVGDVLCRAGVETTLLWEHNSRISVANCGHTVCVEGQDGLAVPPAATPFAQLVSQAEAALGDWPSDDTSNRLLWLHSQGVPAVWCPPRKFARDAMSRSLAADVAVENTPVDRGQSPTNVPPAASNAAAIPYEAINGPTESEADTTEIAIEDLPDELFDDYVEALVCAAADETAATQLSTPEWHAARAVLAGYVELLDWSLGRLLSAIHQRTGRDSTLLIVTAAGGVRAGERPVMSLPAVPLPEELIHTPLLVRLPGIEPGTRRQELVQTVDLTPTLLDWFSIDARDHVCEGQSLLPSATLVANCEREYICLGDGARRCAIRTRERYLVQHSAADEPQGIPPQLFVKPDDVWEVNEVSAQSPDEVEALTRTLEQFLQQTQSRVPGEPPA